MCCFLGLSPSPEETERITQKVHFDEMKKNNMVNLSTTFETGTKKTSFIRKGKVGDRKNHFTVAQSETFDEHYKQRMKNCPLEIQTEV